MGLFPNIPKSARDKLRPKTPLENALLGEAKAGPAQDFSTGINKQFDLAQGRLKGAKTEAQRSALENAQRQGAIQGTAGAGFQSKIQSKAVSEATRPFQEISAGLESERAGQLTTAAQQREQLGEQQRQFDFSANLQRFVTGNEMDLSKFSIFTNAATAFKNAGLDSPEAWGKLFNSGIFSEQLKRAGVPVPSSPIRQAVQSREVQQSDNEARAAQLRKFQSGVFF